MWPAATWQTDSFVKVNLSIRPGEDLEIDTTHPATPTAAASVYLFLDAQYSQDLKPQLAALGLSGQS